MKKIIIATVFLSSIFSAKAQGYDQSKAYSFIKAFFAYNFPDTVKRRHIQSNVYGDFLFLISGNSKQDIYMGLKEYLLPNEIDSLFDKSKEIAKAFSWQNLEISNVKVISDSEANDIIQRASTTIMKLPERGLFKKKKAKVEKYPETTNVVIATTPPLFVKDNYCLMAYNVSYAESHGYCCLYLYKKDNSGRWKEEKLVVSRVS